MARAKYKYWLTAAGKTLLEGWARDGLTDEQMSKKMGISRKTLSAWKVKYSELNEALQTGKEVADYAVERSLYRNAVSGDVTAQIYWLKNRKREKWRDRPDVTAEETLKRLDEVLVKIGGNI